MHNVLSIQSAVAYGHAGNSAAVFPMQRAGVNVWPVYTVNFSNHTGYGAWRGPMISAQDVGEVVQGIDDLGMLATADAVLTGYLGSAEVGNAILAAAKTVKTRNPAALFCADPVMGDVDRGFYARPGIPEFMRDELVGKADIMTPNLFELEFLTGRATTSLADVQASVAELRAAGPKTVLVTSVVASDVPQDKMWMLAVDDDGSWLVETKSLP
ncbi:MAG: pyridoxal kinase [Arachnia propionica]|nr:MAG: pyridoxal kinase [Arachnia propionica]